MKSFYLSLMVFMGISYVLLARDRARELPRSLRFGLEALFSICAASFIFQGQVDAGDDVGSATVTISLAFGVMMFANLRWALAEPKVQKTDVEHG